MPENISKRPDLLIVSDTAVYKNPEGSIVAFEPVVREIEHFAHLFGSITWIVFQYPYKTAKGNFREVNGVNIKYVLLSAIGGRGLFKRLRIVSAYFRLFVCIPQNIKRADVIHTRGPSHPALVAILCSIIGNKKKIFWHKYAGNWIRKDDPFSYKINKYLLRNARRSKVTINGKWPDQAEHVISFENPCLTELERIGGQQVIRTKKFEGNLDFVFVGALTENKGVGRIIETFKSLKGETNIGMLHLVGDGTERNHYERITRDAGINCMFYGSLPKSDVIKVLSKCHVLLLPSDSEGFPKVVAEGANYGCIPVVSDVSCLGQYIENQRNGYIIGNGKGLKEIIIEIIGTDSRTLAKIADEAFRMGSKFTYTKYIQRLDNEILI